jgi:hypothetical protein
LPPPSLPPFIMASPLASIARVPVQPPAWPSASAPVALAPVAHAPVASPSAFSDYLSLDPGPVFMDMAPLASIMAPVAPRAPRTPVVSPLGPLAPALAPVEAPLAALMVPVAPPIVSAASGPSAVSDSFAVSVTVPPATDEYAQLTARQPSPPRSPLFSGDRSAPPALPERMPESPFKRVEQNLRLLHERLHSRGTHVSPSAL